MAVSWGYAEVPGWAMTELTAGDTTLDWDVGEQAPR
jgi:hypothetical protein